MPCRYLKDEKEFSVPGNIIKTFRIEALNKEGNWEEVLKENNNYQRLVRKSLPVETKAIRFIPEETWGANQAHVFAWDIKDE
mgnify:CR=1 FL=1